MRTILLAAASALLLAGCESQVQMTSGADYLARYDAEAAAARRIGGVAPAPGRAAKGIDPAIRDAASVEPILRFPARIGLARIVGGTLTTVPEDEAKLWRALAGKHRHLGEFAAVDPLVAEFTAGAVGVGRTDGRGTPIGRIVDTIRLGAARQHIDAVLIYEVGARASKEATFLAIADLTVIGSAILPTRSIRAEGVARALLLDVRNGYPYGTASASADLSELSTSWGSDGRRDALRREALGRVTESLMPEIEKMFHDLVAEMLVRAAK